MAAQARASRRLWSLALLSICAVAAALAFGTRQSSPAAEHAASAASATPPLPVVVAHAKPAADAATAQRASPVPAAERRTGDAYDFDRAKDLYALAMQSVNSANPATLYNGWLATQVCVTQGKTRSQYEQMAASSRTPRALAAQELLRRCRGFFDNDAAANSGLLARFKDKLAVEPNRYFSGISTGEITQAQVDTMLGHQDWATLLAARFHLKPGVMEALGGVDASRYYLLDKAWLLASCDLGRDCSTQSVIYLSVCAENDKCPANEEAEHIDGLTPSQIEIVQKYRQRIAQAFLAQDRRFFRLVPKVEAAQ